MILIHLSNFEVTPQFKEMVYQAMNNAFEEASLEVEKSGIFEAGAEKQGNKSTPVPVQTGVQNLLIYLLVILAKHLGLKENELEKVFDETLNLVGKYKNKKAEG